MKAEVLDEETTGMAERLVVLRISTKHINLWMRKLEMKRKEIGELAGMMGFDDVSNEIGKIILNDGPSDAPPTSQRR